MRTVADRFWAKVSGGDVDECWVWTAAQDGTGYGQFWVDRAGGRVAAHRWSYEVMRDEIPAGLDLDHLCRRRECVNPWHLEPVTRRENARRGAKGRLITACPQGHRYTPENTYVSPRRGDRQCRSCMRERNYRAWNALQARTQPNPFTARKDTAA